MDRYRKEQKMNLAKRELDTNTKLSLPSRSSKIDSLMIIWTQNIY